MKLLVRFSDGEVVEQFHSFHAIGDSKGDVRRFEARMSDAFSEVADQLVVEGEVEEAWIELGDGRRKVLLRIKL